MWGKIVSALVASMCALVVAVTSGGSAPAGAAVMYGANSTWSGVVTKGAGFTAARGNFVVPTSSARCGNGVLAVWVGLGGFGRLPFVQNGYTVTRGGIAGWYEVFDRNGHTTTVNVPITARPGDVVSPRVAFSRDHSILRFTWRNFTRGTRVVRTVHNAQKYYNGHTAEWVSERAPYDAATDTPLLAHAPIVWDRATAYRGTAGAGAFTERSTLLDLINRRTGRTLERVHARNSRSFATRFTGCR